RDVPDARVHRTSAPGEAARAARAAVREGCHTIVVVGGDGTLTEVAGAVLDEDDSGTVAVGFVPAGTCNDFARGRECASDLSALLDRGRTRAIDAGRVSYETAAGRETRWFVVNCTVGVVSAIGERFTRKGGRLGEALKRASVTLAQGFYGALAIARWRRPVVALELDSERVVSDATNVAVLKVPYFAGGLTFGPARGAPDDGRLEAVLIEGLGRPRVLAMLIRAFAHRLDGHPAIRSWLAREVRVDAADPLPVEVDGEIVGTTPAEFSVHRRRLLTIT
ncbi:MAG TPA: diacylglycerol kinase family protein, partial [Thermoleophilaceae bacterium]|nr:diacylglycerol kinase family protein [Thermoleophilaceae bacterium]